MEGGRGKAVRANAGGLDIFHAHVLTTISRVAGARNRARAFPATNVKPYSRVWKVLENLEKCPTPLAKVLLLSKASQMILQCVDEYYTEKTEQIAMGAEDKFPVNYLKYNFKKPQSGVII
jgi:hypothetical protein